CKAMHKDGEHGTKKMTDRECVEGCVKGGEKYVFIGDKDKVYNIANQDLAALKTHAGHEVEITGTMKGDTVTIEKITMPAQDKQSISALPPGRFDSRQRLGGFPVFFLLPFPFPCSSSTAD